MIGRLHTDEETLAVIDLLQEDREEGLRRLEALALEGNAGATEQLGLYLSENDETVQRSLKWLILAASYGGADAAWNLAMIAHAEGDGEGVRAWIDRAASLGEEDAQNIQSNNYDVRAFLAGLASEAAGDES